MFVENSNWLWLPGMMNDEYYLPVPGSWSQRKKTSTIACFFMNTYRGGKHRPLREEKYYITVLLANR